MTCRIKMDPATTGKRVVTVCFAILALAGLCLGQAASPPSGGRTTTHVLTNWNQFHRRNMTRFNPYERFLAVNNVGT
jgi:hypothetical protein